MSAQKGEGLYIYCQKKTVNEKLLAMNSYEAETGKFLCNDNFTSLIFKLWWTYKQVTQLCIL